METKRTRRTFATVDKQKIVMEAKVDGFSAVARRHNLPVNKLFVWAKKLREQEANLKCHLSLIEPESLHPELEKLEGRISKLAAADRLNDLVIVRLHTALVSETIPANVVAQGLRAAMESKAKLEAVRLEYERAIREINAIRVRDVTPVASEKSHQNSDLSKMSEKMLQLSSSKVRGEEHAG